MLASMMSNIITFGSLLLCLSLTTIITVDNEEYSNLLKLIEDNVSRAYNSISKTNAYEYAPRSSAYVDYGRFDHIVVGAGSAGSVIANRLTEDSYRNVLVLEAGDRDAPITDIPGMYPYLQGLNLNWNYTSVPQTSSCLGMKNRQCAYPRGKGLGGSSLINALIYTRGNKNDYDSWCQEGNVGWCYNDVLPLFKKSENFSEGNQKYHGRNGNLNVELSKLTNPLTTAYFDANKEIGKKFVDYNGETQDGYGTVQLNTLMGTRHNTGKAFLNPILHRKNLHILTNSFVIKILINKRKRAFGVLFSKDRKLYIARSRHDIIISAGTIGSAQILMLSGIGPKNHLTEIGIPVIENLPVGENVEDHPFLTSFAFKTNHTESSSTLEQMTHDYLQGKGLLTNPFNVQGISFERIKRSVYPDLEFFIVPPPSTNEVIPKMFNYNDKTYEFIKDTSDTAGTFFVYIVLLHPKSRGSIRLKSANPFDYPLIDPQMLSHPDDIETMFQGTQLILEITKTEAFQKYDARLKHQPHPDCQKYIYLSRDFWYCQIRHFTTSVYHIIGSCKMGRNHKEAVVNPELKVFGIDNLRVADASIFPSSTSGHTNAPSIMVGEKLAELIRNK